jgi:hypothetical protein
MQQIKNALSQPQGELYREVVKGMTVISLAMRQDVTELDFLAMTTALQGIEPSRVAAAFTRCRTELLFVPKPKEVIDRLPERVLQNQKPDMELVGEFYEPYDNNLRLHVYLYDDGEGDLNGDRAKHRFRQVKLERVARLGQWSEMPAQGDHVSV